MQVGTIVFFIVSAMLFFVVRQFMLSWGLVERRKGDRATRQHHRIFTWVVYFVLWVMPSWCGWTVLQILRELRYV